MAKQAQELSQLNLFPYDPAVKNLGITDVKLKGGVLEIDMSGATEATDLAMIQPKEWAKACAEWLVRLTGGDINKAERILIDAHGEFCAEEAAREADATIGYARNRMRGASVVVEFDGAAQR